MRRFLSRAAILAALLTACRDQPVEPNSVRETIAPPARASHDDAVVTSVTFQNYQADGISMTDLGVLPTGNESEAVAINAQGVVVGQSSRLQSLYNSVQPRATMWDLKAGTMTDFGAVPYFYAGSLASVANDINDLGLIVGSARPYWAPEPGAFYRAPASTSQLPLPVTGDWHAALGVNNAGVVVGFQSLVGPGCSYEWPVPPTWGTAYCERAMIWPSVTTAPVALGDPIGGYYSRATAVNDAGVVVGYANTAGGERPMVWSTAGTVLQVVGVLPGYAAGRAASINSTGQIAGTDFTSTGASRAFLLANGQLTDLGTLPGGSNASANAINDAGHVAGWSDAADGQRHAVLWANGHVVNLGVFGGASAAQGINNADQIVGWSDGAAFTHHAAVWNVSLDATPPVITANVSGTPGSTGWYTSDVTVAFTVTDAESPVTSSTGCAGQTVNRDVVGLIFTCTATSAGGTSSKTVTINRDASLPQIAPTVKGTQGDGGWFRSDVQISWGVSTGPSGIGSSTGCAAQSRTTDTNAGGVAYICTVVSGAGLTNSATTTVMRDATAPVVSYSGGASTYTVDQTVSISCAATDPVPGSGLATSTCAPIAGAAYTFALGANTFSATARDNAGNAATGSVSFQVQVTFSSLCALVRQVVLHPGNANSLCAKLDAAARSAAAGDTNAEHGQIGAFVNEINAQTGKSVPAAMAPVLIRLAQAL